MTQEIRYSRTTAPLRRVTGLEVARRAGVSQSTVSRVMTGKADGRVSMRTQKRVLASARALAYQPNGAGRTLRLGRSSTVALVVPHVTHPFFASMLVGTERTARAHGYGVMLIAVGQGDPWSGRVADALSARAVDGCILYVGDRVTGDEFGAFGPNLVLVDAHTRGVPSVELDIESGSRAAVEHLLSLGHTRIGYLGVDYDKESFRRRGLAYRAALGSAGCPYRAAITARATFDIAASTAAALRILDAPDPPTAIFCDDDLLAAGVYKAARALGLRIPHDLSVCGFCDIDVALMLEPELTTVTVPADSVGCAAMESMLGLVDGAGQPKRRLIRLHLNVRASTAPPPVGG